MQRKKVIIHADGGSRGNPGAAAIGAIVYDEEMKVLESFRSRIGITTNGVAEYNALIKGLEIAKNFTSAEAEIRMDSEFVIKQMRGEYKVRAKHILPLYERAKSLEASFARVTYVHVAREDTFQSQADYLVNMALDGR